MFSVNNKKALGNALNTCLRTGDGFPEDQAEAPPWCSGFDGSVLSALQRKSGSAARRQGQLFSESSLMSSLGTFNSLLRR